MKIQTFETTSTEKMDRLVNEFEEENTVKATQTQHVWNGASVLHYATLFYIPNTDKEPVVKHTIVKG